ncbi:hypothetical protein [Legionella steigerwaltii]|uniref:hypothetical protein n=1 Tax=Legionella steigerwaltii TaxID=460 RepID=UPI001054133B|nr:hypothetical protein [Legionella steigerwaltii]
MKKLFDDAGLDTTDELDSNDSEVQKKFITSVLQKLIPSPSELDNKMLKQVCGMLHQGGLLCRLESEVKCTLTEQGRMLYKGKAPGIERRIYLNTTETGFMVQEVFQYSGSISQRSNAETPEFQPVKSVKKDCTPLISGQCKFDVPIKDGEVKPVFTKMELSIAAGEATTGLEEVLGKSGSKSKTASLKTGLREIVNESNPNTGNILKSAP